MAHAKKDWKAIHTTEFQLSYDQSKHGNAANSSNGKTRPAPSVPGQKQSMTQQPSGQPQLPTVKIATKYKVIECLIKSKSFENLQSKFAVEIEFQGDNIILTSGDRKKLKTCKDKIKENIGQVNCKSKDITDTEAQIFTKEDVVKFINKELDINDIDASWEVVVVSDQAKLNVYAIEMKTATEMSKKICACIKREEISMEDSKNQWYQDLLKNESSKLVTTRTDTCLVIYTTLDVHHEYFVVQRITCNNSQRLADQKGSTANQNSTKGGNKSAAGNQPPETVKQTGQTGNQQMTATQPSGSGSPNEHSTKGDNKDMAANQPSVTPNQTPQRGNQQTTTIKPFGFPTDGRTVTADQSENQVSENRACKAVNKTDQGQIDKTKGGKEQDEVTLGLSFWQYQYLDKYLSEKIDDICKKNKIDMNFKNRSLILKGKQKSITAAKKEIDGILKDLTLHQKDASSGKPYLPSDIKQNWTELMKSKKCLIHVEPCKKPMLSEGWVITTETPRMFVLYCEGPLHLADVDVILCPVDDKLVPIGEIANLIRIGLDSNSAFKIPNFKSGKEELIPIYNTGNLSCKCLLLTVQTQLSKGVVSERAVEKLAEGVITHIQTHGYQSFGLSLDYGSNSVWQTFSQSLVSHLYDYSKSLIFPVVVGCYGNRKELFEELDDSLDKNINIGTKLSPVTFEKSSEQVCKTSAVNVIVQEGSILDFDDRVHVIVNSASTNLDLSNGIVAKQLVKKAGPIIQQECYDNYKKGIDIGDIAITKAGSLKCRYIFHVALYTRWVYNGNISIEILKTLITRCLNEADERRLSSIAFPALGTGTLGYPPCLAAKTMFDAVEEYGKTNPTYLKTVYFVLFGDKDIVNLFRNIDNWRNTRKGEDTEFWEPPRYLVNIETGLETRVLISDRDYYRGLNYKELRIVLSEGKNEELKLEWDGIDGCYATALQTSTTDDSMRSCFKSVIKLMQEKRFHIVDLHIKIIDMPFKKLIDGLLQELRIHNDKKLQENIKNKGKRQPPVINYVKVVRIFLNSENFEGFVKKCNLHKTEQGEIPSWHWTDKTAFPFRIEVVGKKDIATDVLKKVKHEISSVEAVGKFSIKVKKSEMLKAKKILEKLSGVKVTIDENSSLVTCEGIRSMIDMAKQDLEKFEDMDVCFNMSEDDYAGVLYSAERDNWFTNVKAHRYENGKVFLEVNRSGPTAEVEQCVQSKLIQLQQLATIDVTPPNKFEDHFQIIQTEIEKINPSNLCFLSMDKKRIIIKGSGYEQIQQAKYMAEVNLGMVQQSGGRRNRKFASNDAVSGPAPNKSSVPEVSDKDGLHFKTKEGIHVLVYCAGIGNLQVDCLVNAANKELQHGGGIAYHISQAAGYALDKECDDYIRDHGSLAVGTCISTTAGKLPYRCIIHAVGPMWHSYSHDKKQHCLDDLKRTILSTLHDASSNGFTSIAIPSISSGIFGVPKDVCAAQYYEAVEEYSYQFQRKSTSIKEIHFIDKDKGMCSLIQKIFEKGFGRGQKI